MSAIVVVVVVGGCKEWLLLLVLRLNPVELGWVGGEQAKLGPLILPMAAPLVGDN